MKRLTTIAIVLALVPAFVAAQDLRDKPPPGQRESGSLGEITKEAIAGGFDQGDHASNQTNPRAGLANVVEQGDLSATLDAINPN